jgi:hypothetical protein
MNGLFVVKKIRPPESRSMIVDLWSAQHEVGPKPASGTYVAAGSPEYRDGPEQDFWTIFLREGGLADRLLLRITYGMAIYQHLRPVPPVEISKSEEEHASADRNGQ